MVIFMMFSLILIFRINLKLGIPDFLFCMTSDSLVVAIAEINVMPFLVMAANMCPKNIEGSSYALIMSVINFGFFVSYQLGGLVNRIFGITAKNFDNLWVAVLITSLSGLLPIFSLFIMDIDSVMKEKKDIENVKIEKLNRSIHIINKN